MRITYMVFTSTGYTYMRFTSTESCRSMAHKSYKFVLHIYGAILLREIEVRRIICLNCAILLSISRRSIEHNFKIVGYTSIEI
jgi:hypothetical protein